MTTSTRIARASVATADLTCVIARDAATAALAGSNRVGGKCADGDPSGGAT